MRLSYCVSEGLAYKSCVRCRAVYNQSVYKDFAPYSVPASRDAEWGGRLDDRLLILIKKNGEADVEIDGVAGDGIRIVGVVAFELHTSLEKGTQIAVLQQDASAKLKTETGLYIIFVAKKPQAKSSAKKGNDVGASVKKISHPRAKTQYSR